ncbi:nitroreductase family protein [Opitutaceae bacterium TAV1]|nr:nitroreductase family protein [Opitutaceae bacterium TAV1]
MRISLLFLSFVCVFCPPSAVAQAASAITLPAPQKTGGAPLMDTLAKRATSRAFDADAPDLTPQQLSDLLWAAFGINRPDGKRTAPSALNFQEVDIYVLLRQGAFVYNARKHALLPVGGSGSPPGNSDESSSGKPETGPPDLRALGGTQAFVERAALTLVYVTDFSRMGRMGEGLPAAEATALRRETAAFCVGAAAQNASLYCASEGLITGVRMSFDRAKLGAALGLRSNQWISLAQSVGQAKQP